MKKNTSVFLCFLLLFGFSSCRKHLIKDAAYHHKVEARFEKTKELAKNRDKDLFGVFKKDITTEEKEALEFLYAYMPLSDLADYDGDFYLKNVRFSLAARDTFSWGKTIPEREFRHFVLPVRVNNENLDSSRGVFFMELKDRIKHLSMKNAVLEINHWCREQVTYRGTDERTSSPLATIRTAYGRCGEESTFTVAALRAAGIPARQCYTPRWAHCDDNHAWVEVWVDGRWHYIGACEPEPVLDRAWFTEPAKRAMLVNTNVFGDYDGDEDVLLKDTRFTRINVLANYTKTKRIFVKVTNARHQPVDSASVEFQLYNYAEFYPLTRCYTNDKGCCSFLTGYGDLMAWAAKDGSFAFSKFEVRKTDTLFLELAPKPVSPWSVSYDFVPPDQVSVPDELGDSLKKQNSRKVEAEDRKRSNYEKTFIDSAKAVRLAANLKLDADTLRTFLLKSRGNWREMIRFISDVTESQKRYIFPLLSVISEKDLRDIDFSVLEDVLASGWKYPPLFSETELQAKYILNPRIDNEYLKPWRAYLTGRFDKSFADEARKNPAKVKEWINAYVIPNTEANYGRSPITPVGVYELKVADPHSRDMLFVALCGTFGIPSRLEPATKIPQYYFKSGWVDIVFEKKTGESPVRGKLVLKNDPGNKVKPEYYVHFTVEKFSDGYYRSLDYETDPVMQTFPAEVNIPGGSYLLVTGKRISGGTVLANLDFFNVGKGETTGRNIKLRSDSASAKVYGRIADTKVFYTCLAPGLQNFTSGKGAVISAIEPEKEPSRHFIADLVQKKSGFENARVPVILLFRNEKDKNEFAEKNRKILPATLIYETIAPSAVGEISRLIKKQVGMNLPLVLLINEKNDVVYCSEGYRIGTGDELLNLISKK